MVHSKYRVATSSVQELTYHVTYHDIKEILWAGSVCVFYQMLVGRSVALTQVLWKLEFLVALKSIPPSFLLSGS